MICTPVSLVEPVRKVPVVLRNGLSTHRGAVTGLAPDARLNRALQSDLSPIPLGGGGIALSSALATKLLIRRGEMLAVKVREGRQPVLHLPVTAVAEALRGAPAYMDLTALNRTLREPNRVSGAYLAIDVAKAAEIYAALQDMPTVAGGSLKSAAYATFGKLMNTGAGPIRYVMGALLLSSPLASSQLQRAFVKPGDPVLRGQTVVATMRTAPPGALVLRTCEQAQVAVNAAQAALHVARAEQLVARGTSSDAA